MDISSIAGKDAPTIVNEHGGGQSDIGVRLDLVDAKSLFSMAKVLAEGAEKYGENNWRKIDIVDHLNHLIMHAYAYLDGDTSDDHLSHIMCRAMFAQGVALGGLKTSEKPVTKEYVDGVIKEYVDGIIKDPNMITYSTPSV